ncbi:MAG: nicotinate (nicotinamide) nucleotide adenylyltransferase [Candidatus Muiribacteriota bacterium]
MRVGFFGGAFDPVHYGHLYMAQQAVSLDFVDKVIFVVTSDPPHKKKSGLSSFNHRFNMTKLAVENNSSFIVSEIEKNLPSPSYTLNTLKELQKNTDSEIKLLIGMDHLYTFNTWKNYREISENFDILVFPRKVNKKEEKMDFLKNIKYKIANTEIFTIKARFIRNQIKKNLSIRYATPDNVIEYIKRNKLYVS